MLRILDVDWIKQFRLRLYYSTGTVALHDLDVFVNEARPGVEPLRNVDYFKLVGLKDGEPSWPNGFSIPPAELLASIEQAAQIPLLLDDCNDAIVIAKSGAPEPSADLSHWLLQNCKRQWRYRYDIAFNVTFYFEDAADADQFKTQWNARTT